jgi:hypothetical protein
VRLRIPLKQKTPIGWSVANILNKQRCFLFYSILNSNRQLVIDGIFNEKENKNGSTG